MKGYLVTTVVIFAAFSLLHVVRLVEEWSWPIRDPWFTGGVAAIVFASAGLCVWGVSLLRKAD